MRGMLMKYYDKIGFWLDEVETAPGVYRSMVEERSYAGDVIENRQYWKSTEYQNDDLTISNKISIIADLYFNQHISSIKYVTFMGAKWKVKNLDLDYPRVIIELGEVYNGVDEEQED